MIPPTTDPEDENVDPDFLDALVQYDEALRAGQPPSEPAIPLGDTRYDDFLTACYGLVQIAPFCNDSAEFPGTLPPRSNIGKYHIERVIGIGGFAIVYLAHDAYLNRSAAIKVPNLRSLNSADLQRRFVREAQAVARLDHPHIVRTYEAGHEAGTPYIAYAYCSGPTLSAWIHSQREPIAPTLAAEITRSLADAIQYSHSQGILHRDIKPANILLFPEATASNTAFPWLAQLSDFGLAKFMRAEIQETTTHGILGTPRYMAPEQTMESSANVCAATDVYGLGCVLYELLTSQPPFNATTPWDLITQVRNYPPPAPRFIRSQIPPDIEVICLRCLAKDPADRYQTAQELSADLTRFLQGRPIAARPISLVQQTWNWCRRHRTIASLIITSSTLALVLIVVLALYGWRMQQLGSDLEAKNDRLNDTVERLDKALVAERASQRLAEQRTLELRQTFYDLEIAQSAAAWRRGDFRTMEASLLQFARQSSAEHDLREFAWHYLWQQLSVQQLFRTQFPAQQYAALFSPDGHTVAFAGADSVVRLYRVGDFQLVREINTAQGEINQLLFSPDGTWLATAGDDGTVATWELPTGQRRSLWPVFHERQAFQIGLSRPHQWLFVCGRDATVHILHADTGEPAGTLQGTHEGPVECLSVSPDGERVLTGGADGKVVIWNVASQTAEIVHTLDFGYVSTVSWAPDGASIAAAGKDNSLHIWNSTTGARIYRTHMFDPCHSMLPFQQDHLLVGDRGGVVTLFRNTWTLTKTPAMLTTMGWTIHKDRVYGLSLSPDGLLAATASKDKHVAVFRIPVSKKPTTLNTVGPDARGRIYQITAGEISVIPSDSPGDQQVLLEDPEFLQLVLHKHYLIAGNVAGQLFTWDVSGELSAPTVTRLSDEWGVTRIVPLDDDRVILENGNPELLVWNLRTNQPDKTQISGERIAQSPDRSRLAIARVQPSQIVLYDARTLQVLAVNDEHPESIHALSFSPDGKLLVTGGGDRTIRVLNARTLEISSQFMGHETEIKSLAVSHDLQTLASSDDSGSVRLWDLRTGRELFEIDNLGIKLWSLTFTPDDRELIGQESKFLDHRWSGRWEQPPPAR